MFNFSKNKNNIKINILAGNYKLKIKSNLESNLKNVV